MGTAIASLMEYSSLPDENLLDFYHRRIPMAPTYIPKVETDLPAEGLSHDDNVSYSSRKKQNDTKYEGFIKESESIEKWWKGEITQIQQEKGYFSACLVDLSGNTCIAEFDIDKVFDGEADIELNLYLHAKFAFYVVNKHGKGRPRTESGLEFSAPYIWKKKDNEAVSALLNQYFPEDK